MDFEAVIGLEVHAQLKTESKIFCGCSTRFGDSPNANTCPVCLGLPGALPVLNEKAVELALRAGLALNCEVPPVSIFARKNYFYPDLPKGYQISQYDRPLAVNGHVIIPLKGASKRIRIQRVHLEEDAGKLLHEGVEENSASSFVDLNRSGVPLIEIVSQPDLRSSGEANAYLTQLKAILQYCEISDANMEEGNLRCDANISLRPRASQQFGTKVEIKNLNSFRNLQKALEFEIERQAGVLLRGEAIRQETRLFNANTGVTQSMRSKEEAQDYRYFPEPDLPPVSVSPEMLDRVKTSLPELPEQKRERFLREYGLTLAEASILTDDKRIAGFFEETARLSGTPKTAANWILRDVLEKLKEQDQKIEHSGVSPEKLAELLDLLRQGEISSNQAKEVFHEMWASARAPAEIIKERGLTQISDEKEIGKFIAEVFAQNPELVQRYKNGETKLQGVLVGLVLKASGGRTNPSLVNQLIREKISST
jgi:aspartyl-tRNA(Asn)/glutamyl-tRNA(Gln) amidotransferase subunit B